MDWVQSLIDESVLRYRDPPHEILPIPKFSIEMVNVFIMGMLSAAYRHERLASVSTKIESLTIPGNLKVLEQLELFHLAHKATFHPMPAKGCRILQNFCESFTFEQAKQFRLYDTAFQFVAKATEEETDDSKRERWEALNVATLEPLAQALIKEMLLRFLDVAAGEEVAEDEAADIAEEADAME